MEFRARIVSELSMDPYFEVIFNYADDRIVIHSGTARIFRRFPKPQIYYDENTAHKISSIDKAKLELEILNAVLEYIFSSGIERTWLGAVMFNSV